jgi:hypothetical protein
MESGASIVLSAVRPLSVNTSCDAEIVEFASLTHFVATVGEKRAVANVMSDCCEVPVTSTSLATMTGDVPSRDFLRAAT